MPCTYHSIEWIASSNHGIKRLCSDRNIASATFLSFKFMERVSSLSFVIVRHHHGLPVFANTSLGTKNGNFPEQRRLQLYSVEPYHVDVRVHMDQVDRCGVCQVHGPSFAWHSPAVQRHCDIYSPGAVHTRDVSWHGFHPALPIRSRHMLAEDLCSPSMRRIRVDEPAPCRIRCGYGHR